jgi:hypothetical protein
MRNTSIEVYKQIKESGLLSKLRFEVYEKIFKYGPITQGEMWNEHFPKRQRHDVGPRFAELEARGVIECVGERPCNVTGRLAMIWDVTSKLPTEPKKEKTKLQLAVEKAVREERAFCANLVGSFGHNLLKNTILERNKESTID